MTDKPILWDLVNTLYHGVVDNMPESLQERNMASAFILGSLGTYGVVRGLQWLSKKVDKVIPGFDDKALPMLEKICAIGITTLPVLYALADPQGAQEVMTQHPTYTSGMAGVYAGSMATALQDLHVRSHRTPLIGYRHTRAGL